MELTAEQVEFIKIEIKSRGISMHDLADNLLDHICCAIENSPDTDFQCAFQNAISAFGDKGLPEIEKETIILLTLKNQIIMKKTMYSLGYLAAFLTTTGLLFKLQHWPGAAIMLTLGIVLLNFAFLPMYFYDKYSNSIK